MLCQAINRISPEGTTVFRRFHRLFAIAFLLVTASQPSIAAQVSAADLLDSKVDYTADFALRTGAKGGYNGTVIHAQGRDRREFDTMGGRQILLLRRDLDEATMMWPERKWYVTTSFSQATQMVGGFDEMMLDRRNDGSETIGGEPCARYQVTGSSLEGGSFRGKMWFTRDGILLKASGTVRFQGKDTSLETSLSHLQRIKSDPQAFVRPADYKGLPIDLSKLGLAVH